MTSRWKNAGGPMVAAALALAGTSSWVACSREANAMTPQQIEQKYGVSGAYADTVSTPEGMLKGTTVPVTLADGQQTQLFIPFGSASDPHPVYLRQADGLHPVMLDDHTSRTGVSGSPRVVDRRVERPHRHQRSWEKEALIIGGSAGGGAAIGALAGGKKGAGVGAAAGGVGGLIYDLATRNKG